MSTTPPPARSCGPWPARSGVVALGSSDYHGTGKKNHPLGANLTTEADFHRLENAMSRRHHHRG